MPRQEAVLRGAGARVAAVLGKGLLFVVVLVAFGFGFWVLSGDNLQALSDFVGGSPPPPVETAAPPPPAPVPAGPALVVVRGPGTDLRIADGGEGRIATGRKGHALPVTVSVHDNLVTLRTAEGREYTAPAGGRATLQCEEHHLARITENGVIAMKQLQCEDTVTVHVGVEAPAGTTAGGP